MDARRTDAIEYAFRKKDNMLVDLKKARHCLDAAIERLEGKSEIPIQSCKSLVGEKCEGCGKPFHPNEAMILDLTGTKFLCSVCDHSQSLTSQQS